MSIQWGSFALVFGAAILAAAVVVTLFSLAVRLLATPPGGDGAAAAPRDEELDEPAASRPRAATVGAIVLFVLCAAVALYGVTLIIPALHH